MAQTAPAAYEPFSDDARHYAVEYEHDVCAF
jgi:hypothetical protein